MDIVEGSDPSFPYAFVALGDFLYFNAGDGSFSNRGVWRTNGTDTENVPLPNIGSVATAGCECWHPLVAVGSRLFSISQSDDYGWEFAYLVEPTYVLPETNRDASVWTVTLVILAGLTAAASIALRVRGAKRA